MSVEIVPDDRRLSRAYAMALAGEFADRVARLDSMNDLGATLAAAAGELGFRHHALVEHADPARAAQPFLFVHDYPEPWAEAFVAGALHRRDPVQRAASRRVGSFAWRDLPRLAALSGAERTMLADGRRAGLGPGFTVPLHAPGFRAASCSFVMPPGRPLPRRALIAAECLAHSAFQAAHAILLARRAPRLTPRQRQCVALVAQGKTDWETARILGLSEETVTKYLNAARQRFGVARRTQLAVAALATREIALDEIRGWQ